MKTRRTPIRRKDPAARSASLGDGGRSASRGMSALRIQWHLTGLLILVLLCGCRSLRRESDESIFRRMTDIGGIRGPLERALSAEESPLEMGRRFTPEERAEVEQCRLAYERGDYEGAIKRCKKAARRHKESSLGEEAQYYLGESYFALGQYPKAQDAYDQLFEDYPSTRYVEPSTRRMFTIAREWLEISEPVAKNEIRQVSGEKVIDDGQPAKKPADPTLRVRVLPNFHDKTRPVFDTPGRALEALKSIWMNDPTGPLADDALMLTATHYQRQRNYVEADRYYEILREEYPDSRHLEDAFLLGAHVKQMSYQGPYYEGSDLVGARALKEQSLQLFPASQQRQQLRKDLNELYLLEAERRWAKIDYYQKKGKPRAIAIACVALLSEFPDTPFADDARQILSTIDRNVIRDLPDDMIQVIDSLPKSAPPRTQDDDSGRAPVKSVSLPRGDMP
jgi:outer membrane protein assembly factor BamD (BamD/ComL family)